MLRKIISCGAVPYRLGVNGTEVLLIKQFHHREIWGLPKGHIATGETLEECAIREVKEETGISVDLLEKLTPIKTVYGDEEKTVYSWLAKQTCDNSPSANDPDCEVADVRWWSLKSLPPVHQYQRSLFNEVVTILKSRA